jgi:hypothetical protein
MKIWTPLEVGGMVQCNFRWAKAAIEHLRKNRLFKPEHCFPEGPLDDLANWPYDTGRGWTPPQVETIRLYLSAYSEILAEYINSKAR